MKFSFDGVPVDLLYAKMPLPALPENLDIIDPNTLKGLDEKSILSLNG